MLNDYKPTHDPNIDTLQVQYLLGGSALLAVLFPYRYEITEVSFPTLFLRSINWRYTLRQVFNTDAMGLLNLVRIRCRPTTTLHASKNWRSRNHNDALSFRIGTV